MLIFHELDGIDTSENEDEDEEFDWSIEQNPCDDLNHISILGDQCGFANSYSLSIFKMKVRL